MVVVYEEGECGDLTRLFASVYCRCVQPYSQRKYSFPFEKTLQLYLCFLSNSTPKDSKTHVNPFPFADITQSWELYQQSFIM